MLPENFEKLFVFVIQNTDNESSDSSDEDDDDDADEAVERLQHLHQQLLGAVADWGELGNYINCTVMSLGTLYLLYCDVMSLGSLYSTPQ